MNQQPTMMQMPQTSQVGSPPITHPMTHPVTTQVHQPLGHPFVPQQMLNPAATPVPQQMYNTGLQHPHCQPQVYQKASVDHFQPYQESSHAQLQAQQQFQQQIHQRIQCCLAELSALFQYTMGQPSGQMGPIFSEHVPALNNDAETTAKPPSKKRKRLTLPDGTVVKGPRNEYLWWYMEYTKKNKDNGTGSLAGKAVKDVWTNLSEEEKGHYKKLAEEDTKRYKAEVSKAKAVETNVSTEATS